ncbi:hypothetical protein OUZ56_032503 [Daphnia magna]|uniref:Uncharacterized protein n=1 Tax=Daphnia magna TaxID=35525 RepID=A0ABR0B935_9CRUS|nr:hypothetical protein OUZ56_032503 [Daphnia magna]
MEAVPRRREDDGVDADLRDDRANGGEPVENDRQQKEAPLCRKRAVLAARLVGAKCFGKWRKDLRLAPEEQARDVLHDDLRVVARVRPDHRDRLFPEAGINREIVRLGLGLCGPAVFSLATLPGGVEGVALGGEELGIVGGEPERVAARRGDADAPADEGAVARLPREDRRGEGDRDGDRPD